MILTYSSNFFMHSSFNQIIIESGESFALKLLTKEIEAQNMYMRAD